jgi:hypothetical protein
MTTSAERTDDPILKRLRRAPDELYGDRIERAVLFESRAAMPTWNRITMLRCFVRPYRPLARTRSPG